MSTEMAPLKLAIIFNFLLIFCLEFYFSSPFVKTYKITKIFIEMQGKMKN